MTSALPSLATSTVPIGIAVIGILVAGNLRGVRTAGSVFAGPTYLFVIAIALIVVVGLVNAAGHDFTPAPPRGADSFRACHAVGGWISGRQGSSTRLPYSSTGLPYSSTGLPYSP